MLLVRVLDDRSKRFFVHGFNLGGLANLIIVYSTGGPWLSIAGADASTDKAFYHTTGAARRPARARCLQYKHTCGL